MSHGRSLEDEVGGQGTTLDAGAVRERLAGRGGRAYWHALEELADDPRFHALLRRELPGVSEGLLGGDGRAGRREFLRLMGASLALGGLGACTRQPLERIVPYARSPEQTIPGEPLYFATAIPLMGDALGVLVESHMGRPTKVEGNPDHPASLGATDAFAQAAVLSLYDPDRSHSIRRTGKISTWGAFLSELQTRLDGLNAQGGQGLSLLIGDLASPTLDDQLAGVRAKLPKARFHHWTPVHRDNARAGAQLAFGRDLATRYHFDRARVVVALDADFLASGTGGVRYARDFTAARRARAQGSNARTMNRLYCVESWASLTGGMADERLPLRPSEVEGFARALASMLGVDVEVPRISDRAQGFAASVARELTNHRGAGLVVAGEYASPVAHALAHALNQRVENTGTTVEYTTPLESIDSSSQTESLRALVDDLRAGRVDTLVALGGNPVYDAPADLDFAAALVSAPFRVHLSESVDETSESCTWHIPQAHFLESWSDARAYDGTVSIVQPLIAPLYGGRTAHEMIATLLGRSGVSAYDLVRERWRKTRTGLSDKEFESFWATTLHDGLVAGTQVPALQVGVRTLALPPPPRVPTGLELVFRPDAATHDGRFANNGWLQETPRPLTRLTWGNVCLMSPINAREQKLTSGDVVNIIASERRVQAPVWVTPGQPEGSICLFLGYGRDRAGELGTGVGYDAYRLRSSYLPWSVAGVTVRPTGHKTQVASVQDHAVMEGRDLVRVHTFDRFKGDAHADEDHGSVEHLSLYSPYSYEGNAWGMVIDLNACIGCNACMLACQAENNVPIVGKEEVLRGREMHWIRIDRYYEPRPGESPDDNPQVLHQPVTCMHCENAPCEVVCPVGATVHSSEGLNDMVYNRCVGTRYCANNCPYKVRRFNFFHYADDTTESLKLGRNPDVTVRTRGVMEKCTYCVQRISAARIESKKDGRPIQDGEIQSACQQVCPTQAITFGDINDGSSRIAALRKEPDHYSLLGETGTSPRTTYLAKFTNPDHGLEQQGDG